MDHVFDSNMEIAYSAYASKKLDRNLWVVTKQFNYWLDEERTKRINIPAGYLTDGASIPKIFQGLIPPWGPYGQAAVIHDWLCEYLMVWDDVDNCYKNITRTECDKYFNDAMRVLGVSNTVRRVMYSAVTIHSHVQSIIYQKFDQPKADASEFLLERHRLTGEWI